MLDTDTLVDFSKGIEPVTSRLLGWIDGADTVAVCAISVAEFYSGLTPAEAARAERFIASLAYFEIARETAMRAGQDRFALARAGITVTTTDALLAAVARREHTTLVTSNVKDFPHDDVPLLSPRA